MIAIESRQNFYEVLGVTRTASTRSIKSAYRDLARACHPDRHPDDREAEARFKAITEAYEILSNPHRRATYDRGFLPIRSVVDLFQRDRSGQHLLAMVLPAGKRAPIPGGDIAMAVVVAPSLLKTGGVVQVAVPTVGKRAAMSITVPVPDGASARPWCRVSGLGASGRHGGEPGDLFLAFVPTTSAHQGAQR